MVLKRVSKCLACDVGVASWGKYPLTKLKQEQLFRAVADWNSTLLQAQQVPHLVRSALWNMVSGKALYGAHLGILMKTGASLS